MEARHVQRSGAATSWPVTASLQLHPSSAGRPLPDGVLQKMESAFRTRFSDVRVHVGPEAARIGAVAFTVGSSIYFAHGHYHPETAQGRRLLAHELTHVVQQRAGRVANPFGSGMAVVADPALEAEADRMGAAAAAHVSTVGRPSNDARPPAPMASGAAPSLQPKKQEAPHFSLSHSPLAGSAYRVSVATGQAVIGSLDVRPRGTAAELVNLVVQPQHRRHGAGAALIQEAARTAAQRGLPRVILTANDAGSGRLVNWYRQLGFMSTGVNAQGRPIMAAGARTLQQCAASPPPVFSLGALLQRKPAAAPFLPVRSSWPAAVQRRAVIQMMQDMDVEEISDAESSGSDSGTITDIDPLLEWLKKNDPGSQASNYSVGRTDDNVLIISKVGGLGSGAGIITGLTKYLKRTYSDSTVYLAGAFNRKSPSGNHAEMCVVAGALANRFELEEVKCTHPNCRYCAAMLSHLEISGGSITKGEPKNQSTWLHPIANAGFGTQFGTSELESVKALKRFNNADYEDSPKSGGKMWDDSAVTGSCTKLR
jgi:ribosomal protein S18 acetylase RimI-like enzyme